MKPLVLKTPTSTIAKLAIVLVGYTKLYRRKIKRI